MVGIDKKHNGKNKGNNVRKKGKKCAQNKMKCEIEKRIKENGEKIKYIKSELEKKGLKVRIHVVNLEEMEREEANDKKEEENVETTEEKEEENEERKRMDEKKREYERMKKEWKEMWEILSMERKEVREDPKRISNPYEKFKKYLDNAILRKEKSEGLERLRGGGIKKGGMAEKEITIRIEVET